MVGFGMPGMTEWIVILVIVLIFFGAGKLPDVFAQAGKGLKAFKDASEGRPGTTPEDEEVEPKPARKQLASRDPDDLDDEPVEEGASSAQKQRRRPG